MKVISRNQEKKKLEKIYASDRSEFVAVYGRRRVGKTYLIREFFRNKSCIYFELIGQKKENGEIAPITHQLANFQYAYQKAFKEKIDKPVNWEEAFLLLKQKIDILSKQKKVIVLFFDELPWLCSANSGFYENIDQAWNSCFEPAGNVKVLACGSASTWMLKKIIYAKAGLSRRITLKMHIIPFDLEETKEYLLYKKLDLTLESVAEIYMILGGIPYYLNFLSADKSIYQNVEDECFKQDGHLVDEFDLIFDSLFKNSIQYKKLIEVLSNKRSGLNFSEIQNFLASSIDISTSTLALMLNNLYECDFINKRTPLLNEKKGALYFINDEFTLFYLKWIRSFSNKGKNSDYYLQTIIGSQAYKIWLGFSFEMLCYKHQKQIKQALGLHKIATNSNIFYAHDGKKRTAQIDLLFDRADKTITICEIKHYQSIYEITKSDLEGIKNKKNELIKYLSTKRVTRKNILVAFITLFGIKQNKYTTELSPEVITLKDFI